MIRLAILVVLACFTLTACDSDRVFEQNTDFPDLSWDENTAIVWDFEITDLQQSYNLAFNLRNSVNFPFQNMYYSWSIADSTGTVLEEGMNNIELFEAISGRPYNKGIGSICTHRQFFLTAFKFPYQGKYRFNTNHYMRESKLKEVYSVGLRVEKSN
jgi:gliding motility-associated lipoprotein GldH